MLNASVVMSKAEVELGAQVRVSSRSGGGTQGRCKPVTSRHVPAAKRGPQPPCRDVLGADVSCPPPVSTEQLHQLCPCSVSGCSAGSTSSRFAGAQGGAGSTRLSWEPSMGWSVPDPSCTRQPQKCIDLHGLRCLLLLAVCPLGEVLNAEQSRQKGSECPAEQLRCPRVHAARKGGRGALL